MKVFTRDYRITGDYPEPFSKYFEGMRPCVFDIEATGLDPSRSKVCLTALLVRTDTGIRITQFLAENHYEEDRVLMATCDFLERENIDYLITFNGKAYDIPFMNTRLERTFLDRKIRLYDFDLYRFLSKGTDLRKRIGSMSQKSLEDHYGICSDRQDTISGRQSVALFDEYSLTGDSVVEKIILTHNREDVLQLHRLMFLAMDDVEDVDQAMAVYGFPLFSGRYSVRAHVSKTWNMLMIRGDQLCKPVSAAFFPSDDDPLTVIFNASSASYEIDVPAGRLDDSYYIDAQSLGIDLSGDPDCVNGFVILGSRTVNLLSDIITRRVIESRILPLLDAADI